MLRKIAKFFAWLIGGAIGLAVLFYLVVLAINWRDVPPSEEALRFAQMYANRPHVADEMNAFVFMTGMSVVPEHDPMQAGIAMIDAAKKNPAEGVATEYSHPAYPQIQLRNTLSKEIQEFIGACKSLDEKCFALLDDKSLPGIQPNSNDAVLLERYRELIRLPEWQDVYPRGLSGPMPSFGPATDGQTLSMLDIWKTAGSRGAKTTIAMLDADAKFWRKVLVSSDSLITSMLATSALKRNLLWTNVVVRRLSESNIVEVAPASWLQPLSVEERVMERAWVGECIWLDQLFKEAVNHDGHELLAIGDTEYSFVEELGLYLFGPLYNSQDASNRAAMRYDSLIELSKVSTNHLFESMYEWTQHDNAQVEKELSFPRIAYNPVGKLLVNTAQTGEQSFMLVLPNLEGGRRALLATLQLRKEHTPREKVAEALSASPYRNPYTNEPFMWDVATGSVVFEGLSEGKGRRYSFVY